MTEISKSSPVSFNRNDYKVVFLSLLGGALEVFDFIIFVFLATTIAQVFFPTETPDWVRLMESMTIFSVGYIARPLGGLLIAHFSDRYGRKKMFNFTILCMAMPCLGMGLLPGYSEIGYLAPVLLLVARIIQGAALGGEVPNAWVFVAEHAPEGKRGFALGLLQAGLTFGYLLGALAILLLNFSFSPNEIREWAWRLPFIAGGVFGFISLWLRRWLSETPVFLKMQSESDAAYRMPIKDVITRYRNSAIPSLMLTVVLTATVIISVVILPIILQKNWHYDSSVTFRFSCAGLLSLNVGCIISGWLSDRFGAWKIFALYSIAIGAGVTSMSFGIEYGPSYVLLSYIFLGLCCGVIAAVPAVMVQLFPAKVKVTGISLIYNLAYSVCSSVFPIMLLAFYQHAHWTLPLFGYGVSLCGISTFIFYRKTAIYH